MGGDTGLKQLVEVVLKSRARPFLVGLAQATIADDIGNHHGGEPALHCNAHRTPRGKITSE